MSRLIDADKFLEFIKAELKQNRSDDLHIRNIIRVLEDLPPFYDVDNVEEKLKMKLNDLYFNSLIKNDCIALSDKEVNGIEKRAYNHALDIVMGGWID